MPKIKLKVDDCGPCSSNKGCTMFKITNNLGPINGGITGTNRGRKYGIQ